MGKKYAALPHPYMLAVAGRIFIHDKEGPPLHADPVRWSFGHGSFQCTGYFISPYNIFANRYVL